MMSMQEFFSRIIVLFFNRPFLTPKQSEEDRRCHTIFFTSNILGKPVKLIIDSTASENLVYDKGLQ